MTPLRSSRAKCQRQDKRRRRVMIRELNRLNDYYLDDIGISRNDIDAIVDKTQRESQNEA